MTATYKVYTTIQPIHKEDSQGTSIIIFSLFFQQTSLYLNPIYASMTVYMWEETNILQHLLCYLDAFMCHLILLFTTIVTSSLFLSLYYR